MSLSETKPHTKKLYKQQDKQTTFHNKTNQFMTEFNFVDRGGGRILFCTLAFEGKEKQAETKVLNSLGSHSIWSS